MSVNLVTWNESLVTPLDDALVYHTAIENSGIIYGAEVSIKSSNVLHITSGHAILCGRKITIEEEDISVVLPSSGNLNGRLYLHMDLSNTGDPIQLLTEIAATLTPEVQDENVNIVLGVYEMNLCTFRISPTEMSELEDKANREVAVSFRLNKIESSITEEAQKIDNINRNLSNQISSTNTKIDTINTNLSTAIQDVRFMITTTKAANLKAIVAIAAGEYFGHIQTDNTGRNRYEIFRAKQAISAGQTLIYDGNYENAVITAGLSEKVSKTGDTMTGDLVINTRNGTSGALGSSRITLGNSTPQGTSGNSKGIVSLYGNPQYYVNLYANALTANRNIVLPDREGTLEIAGYINSGQKAGTDSFTIPAGATEAVVVVSIRGVNFSIKQPSARGAWGTVPWRTGYYYDANNHAFISVIFNAGVISLANNMKIVQSGTAYGREEAVFWVYYK